MPLISKKTDLRSLRYGNDRPGGGSSGQPYIQKSIPSPEEDPSNIFNTGGKDILLRGGILAPIKGVNDVSRLSQMFFDFKSPSGPLFIAKQNLLSRTSVKTEASKGAGYGGGGVNQGVYLPTSTIAQAGVGFTGTHLNLLGLNPFDPVSPDRGGTRSPLGLNSYFNIVKNQDTENNRLVGLQDAISSGKSKIKFGGQKGVDLNINGGTILLEYGGGPGSILGIGKTKIKFADQRTGDNNPLAVSSPEYFNKGGVKLHTSDDTNSYLSTIGGTNITDSHNVENNELLLNGDNQVISPFTLNNKLIDNVVPKDEIKIYASTPEDTPKISYATSILNLSSPNNSATLKYNNQTQNINGSSLPIESYNSAEGFSVYQDKDIAKYSPLQRVNNSLTLTQGQIIEEPENFGKLSGNPAIKDFRRSLIGPGDSSTIMSLAPDYGGGNAKNIEERLSLGDPGKTRNVLKYSVDQLALDKINARPFYSAASPDHRGISDGNDLVKFSIGILQNDGKGMSNYIHFRAFIEGFSDSYNANWSDTQYVGRGEKFYNYGGFSREISMGWTVYAQSKAELIPMYKKLNYLASSLAPDYSSGGFMRGSLARLTVGGYLYNQLGIIKGLTYTIPDESTWEIGIDENGAYDNSVKELAHMIKVSGFTFIPIQDIVPEKGKSKFIALSNGANTNWDDGFGMPVDNPRTTKEVVDKVEAESNVPTQDNPQTEPVFATAVPVSID